jgi:phosphoserine phosphatase RsbU/P
VKIRTKLLLLEGSITLILFFSLIFSILSLIDLSGINSLYRIILDKSFESKQLKLQIEEILYHPEVNMANYSTFVNHWNFLSFNYKNETTKEIIQDLGTVFQKDSEAIGKEWIILNSENSPEDLRPFFSRYYTRERDSQTEESLINYSESNLDKEAHGAVFDLKYYVEELNNLEVKEKYLLEAIRESIPRIMKQRLRRIIIGDLIALLLVSVMALLFGRRLMRNIGKIRYSLAQVSQGNFSHKLEIMNNDEFGRLARQFNTVTEALWAKLESVQHILHDMGASISNEIELEKAQKAIVYLSLRSIDASGAGLYLFNEDKIGLNLKFHAGDFRPPYPLGDEKEKILPFTTTDDMIASFCDVTVPVGETIIGEAARSGEAILIKRTHSSSFARPKNHPYHVSSALSIPMRVGNLVLGVLCLVHKDDRFFSDLEMANAQSFSELAAISIDNLMKYNEMLEVFELNREIDIAAEIQQNLLPQQIPRLRKTDLAFKTRTCRGINGDFYDCYMIDRERILITVCEVAGKGVPAALVITIIKTILKLVAKTGLNAARILEDLNRNITEKIRIENIAALSLLLYNQNAGTISFASAGNQPLLMYRAAAGEYEELSTLGIPVGLDKNAVYEEGVLQLNPHDFVMLFTDGIPEARNNANREYGMDTLKKMGRTHSGLDAEEMVQEIIDDLDYFHRDSQQWDDQTLFLLKRGGAEQ